MKKEELLFRIQEHRQRIETLCVNATPEQLHARVAQSHWTMKALIAHFTFWEQVTLDVRDRRISAASLKDIDTLNAEILTKTESKDPMQVLDEFKTSGKELITRVENLTEEELHQPGPWGDEITLIEHIADDTYIHYEQHGTMLKLAD